MYVDLRVPRIEKRHSAPFSEHLSVPQASGFLSAPDLSVSQPRRSSELCSERPASAAGGSSTSQSSSASRSGASSVSASPKRSSPNEAERKFPTTGRDRRLSSAKAKVEGIDGWLEFYHRRVPPPSRRESLAQLSPGGSRCRSFSITPKGSVVSLDNVQLVDPSRRRSTGSFNDSSNTQLLTHRVCLVGSSAVGKSCLIEQFKVGLTDSLNEFGYLEIVTSPPTSAQCSLETQSTRIVLDGEEFEIDFEELMPTEVNIDSMNRTDAFVIVYSVTDYLSLQAAEHMLKYLRMTFGYGKGKRKSVAAIGRALHPRSIILVGNKADLARKRTVSVEAGRSLAKRFDCRFLETSACIGHNVDELLVKILKEIRVKHRSSSLPGWSLNLPSVFVACAETSPINSSDVLNTVTVTATQSTPSAPDLATPVKHLSSGGRTLYFKARGLLQRFWTRCDSGRTRSSEDLDVL